MRKARSRVLAHMVVAMMALAGLAASAGGATFTTEPAGRVTIASLGRLTIGGGTCTMTLTAELNAGPIQKVAGEALGTVQSATTPCEGVTVTTLGTPWTIAYTSISGTLPNAVTAMLITLRNVQLNVRTLLDCLYGGDIGLSMELEGTNPYKNDLLVTLETVLPKIRGSGLCPDELSLSATFSLTPRQEFTRA